MQRQYFGSSGCEKYDSLVGLDSQLDKRMEVRLVLKFLPWMEEPADGSFGFDGIKMEFLL
eukprot:snap_masked-scaffold_1-processed-gene-24.55-mRNA-1 protein AED:1.00 eAED:1.00 QI:0/-1/0/0/-1/1/1/0/59